jgi:dATP pyrophosphohydrolase
MPAFKRPESVLIVIQAPGPRFLLLKRIRPADFWQSVTGSLDPGEAPIAAARREVLEETGLGPDPVVSTGVVNRYPIHPAWRHRYAADVTENVEHVFSLVLEEEPEVQLNPREHRAYRWLPAAEAMALASSATDRAAIRYLSGLHP